MDSPLTPPWSWLDLPAPHQREYDRAGVWTDQTLADIAIDRALREPDAAMLVEPQRTWRLGELVTDATALAASLGARGLRPGEVIAFQLPNWGEAAVVNLAASIGGYVINPIVPIYRDAEVAMMLGDARVRALFVPTTFRRFDYVAMAERLAPRLPDLQHIITVRGSGTNDLSELIAEGRTLSFDRPQIDARSVKLLLYTSGTTGRPKGVLHSEATLQRVTRTSADHWRIIKGEAMLMPSPVTHISGYGNGLQLPFVVGTVSILMESWNAADALALIDQHQVAGTVAATPFLVELAAAARAAGNRLPSLRYFACGGAAVPDDLIPAANAAFEHCQAFRVFGSSEVPLVTYGWPDDPARAATSDGQVIDYQVRIIADDGAEVPVGQEGEIVARGPAMMLGYADQAQTIEAIDADGFFHTGDLGVVDEAGGLTVTGRKKDLIIRGGENISAREIEEVLHAHPGVREAAVVAMPHDRLGEGVCAFVIAADPAPDSATLAAHVGASGLARQKIPERFLFVGEFPRTASGKIRKDQLRATVREIVSRAQDR